MTASAAALLNSSDETGIPPERHPDGMALLSAEWAGGLAAVAVTLALTVAVVTAKVLAGPATTAQAGAETVRAERTEPPIAGL